jgi:hypothetical protein
MNNDYWQQLDDDERRRIDERIERMEGYVRRGSALRQILEAERQAADPGKHELKHEPEHAYEQQF